MKKFKGVLTTAAALVVASSMVMTVAANPIADQTDAYAVPTAGPVVTAVGTMGFPDVDANAFSWCVNEINAMAEIGIIKGYNDGTFMPNRTVTKREALVMVARILGFNEEANAPVVAKAVELYGDKLAVYNLNYGAEEICYLLMKDIIFESELADYLGNGAADEGMKRYEVAILLTKGMGAEKQVRNKVTAVLSYADTASIPTIARKYVEYVTNEGFMQGMGENAFVPLNDVTRAQAALVLYKLRDRTNYTNFKAIVASYDEQTGTIRFKLEDGTDRKYKIVPEEDVLRCDGSKILNSEITVGWEAVVTLNAIDDTINSVDFFTTQSQGEVSGRLLSKTTTSTGTTIKVENITSTGSETVTYPVAEDVVVTYGDKSSSLAALKSGDFIKLLIKNREVSVINAENSTKTVKGTVLSIDLSQGISMTVKVGEDEEIFYLDSNVKVAKNGELASLSDVLIGDKVTLTLKYNLITNIEATSTSTTDTGIIESINISQNPTISIKIGGRVNEYPVARDAEIFLDGIKGSIYDLRINSNATIKLESDSIVKIETIPIDEEADVKGEVVGINVSYNLIQVKYVDALSGEETIEQVFVKDDARIISTSSTTDKKLKDVQVGQVITAMGSRYSGVFEATTIIIRN